MLQTTDAIILSAIHTNGDKLVVRALTRDFGKVALLVYGAYSKRSGHKASLIFPLSIVSVSFDFKDGKDLHIAKDISLHTSLLGIVCNPFKSTIALFIGELLDKLIHTGEESEGLFEYCWNSILILDHTHRSPANFHITFLLHLASHLGISPRFEEQKQSLIYFDLMNSAYLSAVPPHPHYLEPSQTLFLSKLKRMTYRNMHFFKFSREEKRTLLLRIIEYYRLHIPSLGDILSLDTLVEYYDF